MLQEAYLSGPGWIGVIADSCRPSKKWERIEERLWLRVSGAQVVQLGALSQLFCDVKLLVKDGVGK
jgi:hypothetical protein